MEKYNYKEAIKEDIINYIKDNDVLDYKYEDIYELCDILNEELWDSPITGNNNDYYDTVEKCEEYLAGNLRLACEAMSEFYSNRSYKYLPRDEKFIQGVDCTIRCYLLDECIYEALRELGVKDE